MCVDPVPFKDHSEMALARESCVVTHKKLPIGVSQVFQTIKNVPFFNKFVFCLAIYFSFSFLVCLLLIQATVYVFNRKSTGERGPKTEDLVWLCFYRYEQIM